MSPEQISPQDRHVDPEIIYPNVSDRVLSAVAGAIEFKQKDLVNKWTDDSLSLLHAHLSERLNEVEEIVGSKWMKVSMLATRDVETGVNALHAVVNEHQIPIIALREFSGEENNGILLTSATIITRNVFKKALEYLQHGVTNEQELKDKKRKGSAYTSTGKGRSSNFRV